MAATVVRAEVIAKGGVHTEKNIRISVDIRDIKCKLKFSIDSSDADCCDSLDYVCTQNCSKVELYSILQILLADVPRDGATK